MRSHKYISLVAAAVSAFATAMSVRVAMNTPDGIGRDQALVAACLCAVAAGVCLDRFLRAVWRR